MPRRQPAGFILEDGREVASTEQCVHCGEHFVMVKGSGTVRGYCPKCDGMVCGPKCAACVPFEKRLDDAEKRGFYL